MEKKHIISLLIIFILIFLFISYFYFNKPINSNGVKWNGKQIIKTEKETKYITIPGFNQLSFKSQQKIQKINLYNPSENSCTMSMGIYLSDGTELWTSNNIQPGNGFYEIELNTVLKSGIYKNCLLNIQCYDKNGIELNGGKMNFTLFVS